MHSDTFGFGFERVSRQTAIVSPTNQPHRPSGIESPDSVHSNGVQERPASPPSTYRKESRDAEYTISDDQTKPFGRHGDINPNNILWFDDHSDTASGLKGTLKLADFGQAEVNSLRSKTKTRNVANTLTYQPPECDITPSKIRQSYDIWCLGCVYLEFITWVLGGNDLLLSFIKKRWTRDLRHPNLQNDTFFQSQRNHYTEKIEIKVKPGVLTVSGLQNRECAAF